MTDPDSGLFAAMQQLDIDYATLWARWISVGGSRTVNDLQDHVEASQCPDAHEHNTIAQALNEVFLERGMDHPVEYRHLYRHD